MYIINLKIIIIISAFYLKFKLKKIQINLFFSTNLIIFITKYQK